MSGAGAAVLRGLCAALLVERVGAQQGILSLRVSHADRGSIVARLAEARVRCHEAFRVLDIGATWNPWSASVIDAVADKFPNTVQDRCFRKGLSAASAAKCCAGQPGRYQQNRSAGPRGCFMQGQTPLGCCSAERPRRLQRFQINVNRESGWESLLRHVERHGKFDYAIASHILEDIANPGVMLEMLPRVAEAGYVAMPSKFIEMSRYIDGLHRGWTHHRWIYTVQKGVLVVIPKLTFLEMDGDFDHVSHRVHVFVDGRRYDDMIFEWRKELPYRILNDDYMGPSTEAIIAMFTDIFQQVDDSDQAAKLSAGTPLTYTGGGEMPLPCSSQ